MNHEIGQEIQNGIHFWPVSVKYFPKSFSLINIINCLLSPVSGKPHKIPESMKISRLKDINSFPLFTHDVSVSFE